MARGGRRRSTVEESSEEENLEARQEQAATKIQALQRGKVSRRRVDGIREHQSGMPMGKMSSWKVAKMKQQGASHLSGAGSCGPSADYTRPGRAAAGPTCGWLYLADQAYSPPARTPVHAAGKAGRLPSNMAQDPTLTQTITPRALGAGPLGGAGRPPPPGGYGGLSGGMMSTPRGPSVAMYKRVQEIGPALATDAVNRLAARHQTLVGGGGRAGRAIF
eukprot:TRINITY_DN43_c0_g1_i1.p1 TRINITY_DN43_c0_g1~~TRINITY_DN43_c0_g1_i1.p1  ORF type:complete len:219 (-),score=41.92 TRINITY_DN43_c0_g1_i1:220-876(-)